MKPTRCFRFGLRGSRQEVIASFHSTEQGLPQHASTLLVGRVRKSNARGFRQRDGWAHRN